MPVGVYRSAHRWKTLHKIRSLLIHLQQTIMYKKKTGVDVIGKILDALYAHNPDALFVMSLMHQYEDRGSLSKKQLEGLYQKALTAKIIPDNWLGTLEAIILKMPTRYKSTEPIISSPVFQKNKEAGRLINAILEKYPQHKRVRFLQTKYENNEPLAALELDELKKFSKLPGVSPGNAKPADPS
jgi:hypothetical protein